MKKHFMSVFLFVLLFGALSACAQVRWGVRVGAVDGDPMIGGDAILRIGNGFYFNPSLEISENLVSTNADAHYDININRDAAFWLGAGIALINPEGQDLDVGVNLLLGLGKRQAGKIIYAQIKAVAPTDYNSYSAFAVGIRF